VNKEEAFEALKSVITSMRDLNTEDQSAMLAFKMRADAVTNAIENLDIEDRRWLDGVYKGWYDENIYPTLPPELQALSGRDLS